MSGLRFQNHQQLTFILHSEIASTIDESTERIESKVDAIQSDTLNIVPIHQISERIENKVDDFNQSTRANLLKIDRTTEIIGTQLTASTTSTANAVEGIQSTLTSMPDAIETNIDRVLVAMTEHVSDPTNRLLQNQAAQVQINEQNASTLSTITRQLEEIKLFAGASNGSWSEHSMVRNLVQVSEVRPY